jgi:lipid A 4'-phosphatase
MSDQPTPSASGGDDRLNRPQNIAAVIITLAAVWALVPQFDLAVSALFYRPGQGFFLSTRLPLLLVYFGTRWYVGGLILILLSCFFYACLPTSRWNVAWRGRIAFLILSLAIGPGLITNTLLKDHWGRARPEQIVDFGGKAHYTHPLIPSRQCKRNCSFPSGHAAAGFWLISGLWIWPHRRRAWLIAGLGTGAVIGLTRIAQGGHFLSDVLGALLLVWLVNAALARWMIRRGWLQPMEPPPPR